MGQSAEQYHPEGESGQEEQEEKDKKKKGSGNLEVKRADLPAMVMDAEENRIELINGRQILVRENKVVPEQFLDVEEANVEEEAQEDAAAIMKAAEQKIEEIKAENPHDVEEQIHRIEALAAVQLAKEVESIRPDHALTATLNSIFLSFSGQAYRVDQRPGESGEARSDPFDNWKMGNQFDLAPHAYVIPYSLAGEMKSLFEDPPLAKCLQGKVGFEFVAGNFIKGDFLKRSDDDDDAEDELKKDDVEKRMQSDEKKREEPSIGFTVRFIYNDKKGLEKTEEIMFLYGKETSIGN